MTSLCASSCHSSRRTMNETFFFSLSFTPPSTTFEMTRLHPFKPFCSVTRFLVLVLCLFPTLMNARFHRFGSNTRFFFFLSTLPPTYRIEDPYSIYVYAANTYRHPPLAPSVLLPLIPRYIHMLPCYVNTLPPFFF